MRNVRWDTLDEVWFIRHLGQCSSSGETLSHRALVARYRDAMRLRKDWGDINVAVITAVVNEELAAGHAT